jgi:AcrR family transcriptional regulator
MPTRTLPERLTRKQQQERTREDLLAAAAVLFADQGFGATSVEAIAEYAGFTRGAFYSNFESKDDIFLTLLERRGEASIQEVGGIYRSSASLDEAIDGIKERNKRRHDMQTWLMLGIEFRLHAMRNPKVRKRFAAIMRREREGFARAAQQQFDQLGLEPPAPVEDVAIILQVIDHGIPELEAIDPDNVRKNFFFDALVVLAESGAALARERAKG